MLSTGAFDAIGCVNSVTVPDAGALPAAMRVAREEIARIDRACSRFRSDSELSQINGSGGGEFSISPLLAQALEAALHTAVVTDGVVDPTVGARLRELGYTVTFRDLPPDGPPIQLRVHERLDWTAVQLDAAAGRVALPPGVELDLGASGKAWAADHVAAAVARETGLPAAVCCGGDVAVCGAPAGGWPIRVAADRDSEQGQDVTVVDGGVATSGPGTRRWRRGGVQLHHVIDPATGMPAETPWEMVTVAAASCVDANAAATAALILGARGPEWLAARSLPARLVDHAGAVTAVGGWPC